MMSSDCKIEGVRGRAYTIPTDAPESDGTLEWNSTTLVTAEVEGGGKCGFGYTYGGAACAALLSGVLADCVRGGSAMDIESCWQSAVRSVRNIGWPGIAACAISALDIALWDLKAQLLKLPLARLLGQVRDKIPAYGSGGFTSYTPAQLARQLEEFAAQGCRFVKMKVGRQPERDVERAGAARDAIGDCRLFVDANGAYTAKQALDLAARFRELGVEWFEEPVSSDDLAHLHFVRSRVPPGMNIAAGEYGYTPGYFRAMLQAEAVDVLQADATRCGGITGFSRVAALCDSFGVPLSSHCAPSAHRDVAAAVPRLIHLEWFHDHSRIEQTLFEGAPHVRDGSIEPNETAPGSGLSLRGKDAERYAVSC